MFFFFYLCRITPDMSDVQWNQAESQWNNSRYTTGTHLRLSREEAPPRVVLLRRVVGFRRLLFRRRRRSAADVYRSLQIAARL